MKEYKKPVILSNHDLAEGVFAASGCSYINPTITVNERDYNGNKYRITIKAKHADTENCKKKNAVITLTSDVSLNGLHVDEDDYSCAQTSGTTFTINYLKSHHSKLECQVIFSAEREPVLNATIAV